MPPGLFLRAGAAVDSNLERAASLHAAGTHEGGTRGQIASLRWLGRSLAHVGRMDEARRSTERALALAQEAGEAVEEAWCYWLLSTFVSKANDMDSARRYCTRARAIFDCGYFTPTSVIAPPARSSCATGS